MDVQTCVARAVQGRVPLVVLCYDCQCARRREVERDEGMVKLVKDIQGSDAMASALLVECRGRTPEALEVRRVHCKPSYVLHVPVQQVHFC